MISIKIYCSDCQQNYQYTKNEESAFSVKCEKCGNILLEFSPINGYLYILSNPSMPSLLKIGFTTRTVDERVAELNSSTSVPDKFIVEAYFCSSTPENDERLLHAELNDYRKNGNREFFQIPIFEAIEKVGNILAKSPDLLGENGQAELQRKEELRRQEELTCSECNGELISDDVRGYKFCPECRRKELATQGVYGSGPRPRSGLSTSYGFICKKCGELVYLKKPMDRPTTCPYCFNIQYK